jgi:uncharacterized BrkB/YihY/UPF0761 family membrane protein
MGTLDRVIDAVDRVQQRHRPSAVAVAVLKKYGEDNGRRVAAAVAFYGFFSIFPLMLVLVSVLGLVLQGNDDLRTRILDTALAQFPVIGTDIKENVGAATGSLVPSWSVCSPPVGRDRCVHDAASCARPGLGRAVGQAAQADGAPTALAHRGSTRGCRPCRRHCRGPARLAGVAVRSPSSGECSCPALTVAVVAALFAGVFRWLTSADVTWRSVLPGAVMAGIGWVLLGAVGGLYITRVVQGASDTYGVFAVVIGLLSWLLLLAELVVLSAELNVVLTRKAWPRPLREEKRKE